MNDVFWAAFGGGVGGGVIVTLIAIFLKWIYERPLLNISIVIKHKPPHMSVAEFKNKLGIPFDQQVNIKPADTRVILIKIMNPHPKVITVEKLGFSYKSKSGDLGFMEPGQYELSCEIKENKAVQIEMPEADLFAPLIVKGKKPSDIKYVWVETQASKFKNKIDRKTIVELDNWFQEKQG